MTYPTPDEVQAGLGDKPLEGLASSVTLARADLADYRTSHPSWVAGHSERGLANWIHDRVWVHLVEFFDGDASVQFVEAGPTRELYVHGKYRLRAKRHAIDGAVRNAATQTVLEFFEQEQGVLDGMEEVRLLAGYLWLPDTRDIGEAVLSLRDGQDNVVWQITLPETGATGTGGVTVPLHPADDGPLAPAVEFRAPDEKGDTGTSSEST